MNWNLVVTGPARKQLQRLSARDRDRVKQVLLAMQDDPFGGDLKRLIAQPSAWRRRVGNHRILFDIDYAERLVAVHAVVRRTSTTY
jgi:mRNA-degrading endonuclease RelE of RelBE toxin-antitoxin system